MRKYYVINADVFNQFITENSLTSLESQPAIREHAATLTPGEEYVVFEEAGTIAPEVKAKLNYKSSRKLGKRKPKEETAEQAKAPVKAKGKGQARAQA